MEINIWYILAGLFYLGHGWDYVTLALDDECIQCERFEAISIMLIWPVFSMIRFVRFIFDD